VQRRQHDGGHRRFELRRLPFAQLLDELRERRSLRRLIGEFDETSAKWLEALKEKGYDQGAESWDEYAEFYQDEKPDADGFIELVRQVMDSNSPL